MTMTEHSERPMEEIVLCYMGDAHNNVANSLMVGGCKLGMDVRLCAPKSLWPEETLVEQCKQIANPILGRALWPR